MTDTARKPGQPYAIAAYLPVAAIAAALAHTYDHATSIQGAPRDAGGCCPLGRAMFAERAGLYPTAIGPVFRCPQAIQVAGWLEEGNRDKDRERFQAIWDAARAFIDDWDAGLISDLPAALGLGQQVLPGVARRAS